MKKFAKAKLSKETIKGRYGPFEAYIVRGDTKEDTYNIKDDLKRLGFAYFKGSWWISAKKYNNYVENQLKQLNVTTSQEETQTTPREENQPSQPSPQETQHTQYKQWETENPEMSKWYGFPINHNILSYEMEFEIEGEKYQEPVTVDRLYVRGKTSGYGRETKSREHRGIPMYVFKIGKLESPKQDRFTSDPRHNIATMKFLSKEKWGNYNEEDYLDQLKDLVKKKIEGDPNVRKSNARDQLLWHYDFQKRSPELKELLSNKDITGFEIDINDQDNPKYNGTYPIKAESIGGENDTSVYIYTNLNHPLNDRETMLESISLYNVHTPEDLRNKIQEEINKNKDEIEKKYIDFLQSFPFLDEQQNEAKQDFERIKSYLENGIADADTILNQLQRREYIRPRKRKRQTEGLSSGEEIKWVVDSKKIVNDAYSPTQSPDYFYAVIAYYIHRKVRGIWSWTDMMLHDALSSWYRIMKRFGMDLTFGQMKSSVESIGNVIVDKIYGQKTKEKINEEFREWFDGGQMPGDSGQIEPALIDFANFAKEYDIEIDNITENAKYIYRALAKNIHPDLYTDPNKKEEMEQKFKELQNIWDRVPQQYKSAFSWYKLEKTSSKYKI